MRLWVESSSGPPRAVAMSAWLMRVFGPVAGSPLNTAARTMGPVQCALFDDGFLCLLVGEHVAKQQTRASWDLLPAVTDPCCGHHHEALDIVHDHRVDDRCGSGR